MSTNQNGESARPWRLVFTPRAAKDGKLLVRAGLASRAESPFDVLRQDPFSPVPPYEKLVGRLARAHSRRINLQRRLVYEVFPEERTVKIIRMWSHYE